MRKHRASPRASRRRVRLHNFPPDVTSRRLTAPVGRRWLVGLLTESHTVGEGGSFVFNLKFGLAKETVGAKAFRYAFVRGLVEQSLACWGSSHPACVHDRWTNNAEATRHLN